MHPLIRYSLLTALLALIWSAYWYAALAGDVARVNASIRALDARFKQHNRALTFKAEAVARSGFPLHFRVRVVRPAVTMVLGLETYGISTKEVILTPTDSAEGRYRVALPAAWEAVYAHDGALPEQYEVTLAPVPQLSVRAAGDATVCAMLPGGNPCPAVPGDAVFNAYALGIPASLRLEVARGAQSRTIGFNGIALQIPVFMSIPGDASGPLEIAVNVLREAFARPADGR